MRIQVGASPSAKKDGFANGFRLESSRLKPRDTSFESLEVDVIDIGVNALFCCF